MKLCILLFNKIPSQEIQNLSYDKKLSWLRIQTSSSSEVTFSNSSVASNHNSNNKIGVTLTTKEKLNVKLENQLLKLIRSEFKEKYYPHHFSKLRFIDCGIRISRSEVFLRKDVLKICSKFTEEHPCRSVISIMFLK